VDLNCENRSVIFPSLSYANVYVNCHGAGIDYDNAFVSDFLSRTTLGAVPFERIFLPITSKAELFLFPTSLVYGDHINLVLFEP